MMMANNEITIKIKPEFEFETNGQFILDFLKQHYEVPNGVVGFDLSYSMDGLVNMTWHTYLTKK